MFWLWHACSCGQMIIGHPRKASRRSSGYGHSTDNATETTVARLVVLSYPTEKYAKVSWDDELPNILGKIIQPCSIIDNYIPLYPIKNNIIPTCFRIFQTTNQYFCLSEKANVKDEAKQGSPSKTGVHSSETVPNCPEIESHINTVSFFASWHVPIFQFDMVFI